MLEVKVVDSLTLPDMALVRLVGPEGRQGRQPPAAARQGPRDQGRGDGRRGRRRRSSRARSPPSSPSSRPRAASSRSAPTTRRTSSTASARRARSSRCRPRTWSSKIAGEAGLSARRSSRRSVVHEFFQQSNETDWDFIWRLALMHDYEVVVDRHEAQLPHGEQGRRRADRAHVAGQHDLVPPAHERRPAAADGQRPRLGPEGQAGRHRHAPAARRPRRRPASQRSQGRQRPRRRHDRDRRPRRGQQRRGQRARQGDAAAGWPTRSSRPTASPSATRRSRPAPRSRSRASAQKFSGKYTVTLIDAHTTAARPAIRPPSRSPGARAARCWS